MFFFPFCRILFRVSSAILGIAVTQEGCENFIKGQHKVNNIYNDNFYKNQFATKTFMLCFWVLTPLETA